MKKIYFIIGASGSGKTTTLKALEKQGWPAKFCYFDSAGVSTVEEMIKDFCSEEEWQRLKIKDWVKKIKNDLLPSGDVFFDVQARPSFIEEACLENKISNFEIILFDCENKERIFRLKSRGQSDLANEKMINWADFLRKDCQNKAYFILDNSGLNLDSSLLFLKSILTQISSKGSKK